MPLHQRVSRLMLQASAIACACGVATSKSVLEDAQTPLPAGVERDWWGAVQQDIVRSEYAITLRSSAVDADVSDGYQAPNRSQSFRTHFTAEGIRVVPRAAHAGEAPAWSWGLELTAWGAGGAWQTVDGSVPVLRANGNRIEYVRDGITEWYVNDQRGLEQGFTVDHRPKATDASNLRVEMAVSGTVTAHLMDGGQAADFLAPGGARAVRFDHLHVVDATGRALHAWFELCEEADASQRLSIIVNDAGAAYPITIDPLATSPAWTAESDQAAAEFGFAVATAGDVNGDGFSDVIVGAPSFDNDQANEGRAFVYLGSASGLSLTADWTAESDQADAEFAFSVATAGDVNGDGFSDVIIGAPFYGTPAEGRAYVYHGSKSGLSSTHDWIADVDNPDSELGASVASAGDVNGDGFSDVIIGAPQFDHAFLASGRAFVWHGSRVGLGDDGTLANADWLSAAFPSESSYGGSVSTAGDVNGDGFSDVIIGAESYTGGGGAFLWLGSSAGLGPSAIDSFADWRVTSNHAGDALGCSVATAGDVNGDGFSDVIIGMSGFDLATVWHGSSADLGPDGFESSDWYSDDSNFFGSSLGHSVASAGDVNGDGYGDVIVGAPGSSIAAVIHGSPSGLQQDYDGFDQAGGFFGGSVATAGDVNGDGFSDVIVGASAFDNGQKNEGRAFLYLGAPAGLATIDTWTDESNQASAQLGLAVSAAGDVNGDGFGDVIVGAYSYDNGEADEGRVHVYFGKPAGLTAGPDWTAESNQAGAFLGAAVSMAGDVNGDGYGDILTGSAFYDNGQTDEGRAFLWLGSSTGLGANGTPTNADWSAQSDQAGALFGVAVGSAGDVNGDGFSDVIIGAREYDNGQIDEGRAFVWLGSSSDLGANGTPANADWSAESDQAGALFGRAVSTAGDVNGDGFSDVIVGADHFKNSLANEGRAFVYHGSSEGLNPTPDWTADSGQEDAFFANSARTAGDVNGDGFSDVIIGAPYFDDGNVDEGKAFVWLGSSSGLGANGTPGNADWSAEGDQDGIRFSLFTGTAGDVNGDGFSDVIIAAPYYANGETNEGRALVYHGAATGLSLNADWTAEGDQANALFGYALASAGDVNGDGYGDVIVGAHGFDNGQDDEGRIFLYLGNEGSGRTILPRQMRLDSATPIAPLGRSDHNTQFRILATLGSIYGRTNLQMDIEVRPLGEPFFESNGPSGFLDTGIDGVISFNSLVSGPTAGTLYHWRVRAGYDLAKTPFQRYGPWITMPTNGWNEADLRTAGVAPLPCLPDVAPSAGDGIVGIADLLAVIGEWGACDRPCTPPSTDAACPADVNNDCVVGIADLLAVIGAWGACP